ncbi:MAG: hypothetical protein LBR19_01570 [Bifidobacteriaceae bacterium]|nr:hypothetical protein [Bifidobacteriaceae bacterium]
MTALAVLTIALAIWIIVDPKRAIMFGQRWAWSKGSEPSEAGIAWHVFWAKVAVVACCLLWIWACIIAYQDSHDSDQTVVDYPTRTRTIPTDIQWPTDIPSGIREWIIDYFESDSGTP